MRGVRIDPERREVRLLLRHAPLEDARVLEIGCGNGRLSRRIAGAVRSLAGMDVHKQEVAAARRFLSQHLRYKARFALASAEQLPFTDQYFDVVLFSWSL